MGRQISLSTFDFREFETEILDNLRYIGNNAVLGFKKKSNFQVYTYSIFGNFFFYSQKFVLTISLSTIKTQDKNYQFLFLLSNSK